MNQLFDFIDSDSFLLQNQIDLGPFSKASLALHKETKEKYVQRLININQEENIAKFNDLCNKLFNMHYPCSSRPSFASLPDLANNIHPALYTHYAENLSLKMLIQRLEKGELIENYDSTQMLIIIYGILLFLDGIHHDNKFHGRLKISNVLLDSHLYPFVSDAFLSELNEGTINEENCEMIDYIVSLPPEVIENNSYTLKSDMYSFGILILQILTHQINVYKDITDNCSEILQLKKNGQLPSIPEIKNNELLNFICLCLDSDPDKRPTANEILSVIEEMGNDEHKYDIQRLKKFKSINNSIDEIENPDIKEMKKLADEGDVKMMYEYGRLRYHGDENCQADLNEAIKYISKAAEQNYENAKAFLPILYNLVDFKDEISNQQIEDIQDPDLELDKSNKTKKITHLKDDPFFTREKADISKIIEEVKKQYNFKELQKFDEINLGKKSFIFTPGAVERLTKLYNYLESKVPVLLEGPTGTSKTLSSEIVCQLRGSKLLRFNLSSETRASFLLGRYKGDKDSWAGISMSWGPFLEAYENGCVLLLDEIYLASPECLQFIGEALDSGKISIEMPGMPLREIPMNENFRLIATQNPNKGIFANKRQDLDEKFTSRFQVINFPAFTKEEFLKIAQGLANAFQYDESDKFIEDLVDFHMTWSSRDDVKGDVQCFTVREVAATVHALADKKNNVFDTIMTIYGARYPKDKKNKLKDIFLSYESFKDLKPAKFEYPENFSKCFHNKSLEEALKAIYFSFTNNRNVILTGTEGSGITQLAKWVARNYNSGKNNSENESTELFCVCTEETKCSDIIGHQKPSDNIDSGQELISFKLGLLPEAIQKGLCVVFDSLNEAPSTVTERLNGLFDEKYDGEKRMFEITEDPQGKPIEISKDFRLLCTCRIDKINEMSPAFVNRFDVIFLENQLDDIKDEELRKLIEFLMTMKFATSSQSNSGTNNENTNDIHNTNTDAADEIEEKYDNEEDIEEIVFSDDEEVEDADQNIIVPQESDDQKIINNEIVFEEFKPSEDLINLVFNSFDRTKITMYKLSQFCKAVSKYYYLFSHIPISDPSSNEVQESKFGQQMQENIVKLAADLVIKTDDFVIPKEIEDYFIKQLTIANTNDDGQYFFKESPLLSAFLAKLYAASIINLPLYVYGATGVGKTSTARAFGRLRKNVTMLVNQQRSNMQCLMQSFHAGTKPNHFYGTTVIKNGKVAFINGTLTTVLQRGCMFIADEMNLAPIATMKALAPALEPYIGEKQFIPGVGESFKIHPDFFFIACQNELGTIGRNVLPSSIASRFRILYYPTQQQEDISQICYEISKSFYFNKQNLNQNIINLMNNIKLPKNSHIKIMLLHK